MRTPIIDGQSIEQFIPAHLKDMFYNHPMPEYKYAIHNGLDPYGWSTEGLVLYLPLWALKGSVFKSVDAYKHTATIVNNTLWQPNGRYFDGVNDKITIADHSVLNITGSVTFIVWVHFEADGADTNILNKWDGLSALTLLFMRAADNKIYCFFGGTSGNNAAQSSLAVTINTWYHAAACYDGAKTSLELNGIDQEDAVTPLAPAASPGTDFLIGERGDGTNDLTGRVGEVWIYNRALSVEEIVDQYNRTAWRYR